MYFDEKWIRPIFKQEKEGRLAFRRPSHHNGRQSRPLSGFSGIKNTLLWLACLRLKNIKWCLIAKFYDIKANSSGLA
nr:hypothetical protein [uncultured Ruminococcus sp.]